MGLRDIRDEEIVKKSFDEYDVQAHEKHNLQEIRKKLEQGSYEDASEVKADQELIENMMNHFRMILQNERAAGAANLELENYMAEAHKLHQDLEKLRKKLQKKIFFK